VASNLQAAAGSYVWTVPNGVTKQGLIRISEVGGSIIAESGIFSIVDQTASLVRVIAPNGGESYTEGDPIQIRWTATPDLTSVGLSYSSDGGATWRSINSNVLASTAQYGWTAPSAPGTQYRVKVDAGSVSDMSDNNFTVARKPQPKLTVVYPNGGEKLTVGKSVSVAWTSQDISGMVSVEYSTSKGAAWKPVGTATAATGTLSWMIPDEPSAEGLVRVVSLDLSTVADTSDALFTIEKEVVIPLVLISPNGSEKWVEKETRQIRWTAPGEITQVEFHYSVDGGQNWKYIAGSASTAGANSYDWTVPQESTTQALVRIRSTADNTRQDISDAEFSIAYSTSSVPTTAVAGGALLKVLGVYPNPFAATAEVRWMQGGTDEAMLRIFDGSGRVVRQMEVGRLEAGEHRLIVNAGELPSGAYHFELRVGGRSAHGTMMIVR
jgi:hypothetical protein